MPASVDLEKETVITGRVVDGSGQAVGGAFVRLLDSSDEFTAEVVASATGDFRFFAAPGTWTLRALSPEDTHAPRAIVPRTERFPQPPASAPTTPSENQPAATNLFTGRPPRELS